MKSTAPLARDVIDVTAEHLNLPKNFTRQVITALKAADRIDHSRPISPPITPLAIARILLALASPTIRDAVRHGAALGALPLAVGDSQPTLEVALTDMIEEAAGYRYGETDFRSGQVILGDDLAIVGGATFRTKPAKKGVRRFIAIDNQSIGRVARDLLPSERA